MQKVNRLSDRTVRTATVAGKLHDGGGLYLVVTQGRTGINKSWSLRYSVGNGKHRYCGLGAFPLVTLQQARRKAADARELLSNGKDPISHKVAVRAAQFEQQASRSMTFRQCAAAYIAGHEAGWRNRRNHERWTSSLEMHVVPVIGDLPVDQVTREHVIRILRPIWATRTETATQIRGRIEAVLSWATFEGYRNADNPAVWKNGLEHALPPRAKVRPVVHRPALAYAEVPAFISELRQRDGNSPRCLQFCILTATRAAEAAGARWSEIDLAGRTWVIPRERVKTFKEHRVPLSAATCAILEAMPRNSDCVFSGQRGALRANSLLGVLLRMGVADQFCVHGFRSSFSSWAREATSHPREIVEAALGHVVGDAVERSYARGDALERRRALMEQWGQFCTTTATVLPLRAVS